MPGWSIIRPIMFSTVAASWPGLRPIRPVRLGVYGATKLEGEQLIAQSGCRHLIFRTSWVYGARGGNFAKTMLRLAQERDLLKIIDDQIGAPTGARPPARRRERTCDTHRCAEQCCFRTVSSGRGWRDLMAWLRQFRHRLCQACRSASQGV